MGRIEAETGQRARRPLAVRSDGRISYHIDRLLAPLVQPAETVVISGFWRSGTTWLQEAVASLLEAKTVFEPLHFMVPAARELHVGSRLPMHDASFLELYMPYCGTTNLVGHPLHGLFHRALRADIPGDAVRSLRKSVTESFRRRVVLKCVRAQLALRAIHDTFGMPLIHIHRDPRAVVASIKMTDWAWLFDHLALRAQLFELEDGRADRFAEWRDAIAACDEQGTVARISAYWALTETMVQRAYVDRQSRVVFIGYEELSRDGEKVLRRALERLNVRCRSRNWEGLMVDSVTTSKSRRGASSEERVAGWKRTLTTSEIELVERVVGLFGLEERLCDGQ